MAAEKMSFVVKSAVKEYIAKKGLRTSAESFEVLNETVERLISDAIRRAKAGNAGTVKSKHI